MCMTLVRLSSSLIKEGIPFELKILAALLRILRQAATVSCLAMASVDGALLRILSSRQCLDFYRVVKLKGIRCRAIWMLAISFAAIEGDLVGFVAFFQMLQEPKFALNQQMSDPSFKSCRTFGDIPSWTERISPARKVDIPLLHGFYFYCLLILCGGLSVRLLAASLLVVPSIRLFLSLRGNVMAFTVLYKFFPPAAQNFS